MKTTTFCSENALMPGLIRRIISNSHVQTSFRKYASFSNMSTALSSTGIDVSTQKFSVFLPGSSQWVNGTNTYGILRTLRGDPREAMALHVEAKSGSEPLLFALVEFFAKHVNFLSRDLVVVISEGGIVGTKVFLDAYHDMAGSTTTTVSLVGSTISTISEGMLVFSTIKSPVIQAERLRIRSGNLQAALVLNLPIKDMKIAAVNLLIEGVNGLLPNLDFVYIMTTISAGEGVNVHLGSEPLSPPAPPSWLPSVFQSLWKTRIVDASTLFLHLAQRASGVPSGSHGIYHNYHIESVTLLGRDTPESIPAISLARSIEGVIYCVNNLLERLHASFFFYIMVTPIHFVSSGIYMIPWAALVAGLIVQLGILWFNFYSEAGEEKFAPLPEGLLYSAAISMSAHLAGGLTFLGAPVLCSFIVLLSLWKIFDLLLLPSKFRWETLKCFYLIDVTITLCTTAILNYSLSLFLALTLVPLSLAVRPSLFIVALGIVVISAEVSLVSWWADETIYSLTAYLIDQYYIVGNWLWPLLVVVIVPILLIALRIGLS